MEQLTVLSVILIWRIMLDLPLGSILHVLTRALSATLAVGLRQSLFDWPHTEITVSFPHYYSTSALHLQQLDSMGCVI